MTPAGTEIPDYPNAAAKVWAAERLAGKLHPALSSARSQLRTRRLRDRLIRGHEDRRGGSTPGGRAPRELVGVQLM